MSADDQARSARFLDDESAPDHPADWRAILDWLQTHEERRLEHLVQQFAESLRNDRALRVEELVAGESAPFRDRLLAKLIQVETLHAQSRHMPVDYGDYLRRFPQMADWIENLQKSVEQISGHRTTPSLDSHSLVDLASASIEEQTASSSDERVAHGIGEQTERDWPRTIGQGRYEILQELGVGGQKRVDLAMDRVLQRKVVVAMQLLPGNDRLREEAALLAQLSDHPHIVSIYDLGEENGFPYIVSQYVNSGSLRDLLSRNDGRPIPIPRALQIVRQTCEALAHAHLRQVLHLDVKPGNVWLMEDGSVRLGDFGLARRFQGQHLVITQEFESTTGKWELAATRGTPAYMAPEQILNQELGPGTDLYAVGVMLYEMVTGQRPFGGRDLLTLVSQHLNTEPVAPSRYNSQVEGPLNELILSLLEKSLSRRPADAAALAEQLADCETHKPVSRHSSSASPLRNFARGLFVGRRESLAALHEIVESSLKKSSQWAVVYGEPGSGKTRLIEELATYAQLRQLLVVRGRCAEAEGAPPFWPWIQILRDLSQRADACRSLQDVPGAAPWMARMDAEIQRHLGVKSDQTDLSPPQARFQLFDSIARWFVHYSQRQPLLLLIDDVQWADEASMKLLLFLQQACRETGICLVATCRNESIPAGAIFRQTLETMLQDPAAHELTLTGMPIAEVRQFLEMTIGRTPNQETVEKVRKRTNGNPLFLQEALRLLASEGAMERLDELATQDLPIPRQVHQVIHRRLQTLSEECRRLLTFAAILGRRLDFRVLSGFFSDSLRELLEAMEEAVQSQVLDRNAASSHHYDFVHDVIRESILAELPATRRIDLHLQAAATILQVYDADLSPHYSELSWHYWQAMPLADPEAVVRYSLLAASHSRAQLAYEDTLVYYQRASEVLQSQPSPDWQRLARVSVEAGEVQRRMGQFEPSLASFRLAIEWAQKVPVGSELAEALIGLEASLWQTAQPPVEAIAMVEKASARLESHQSSLRARLNMSAARAIYHLGGRDRAIDLAQQALRMAKESADRPTIASVLGNINHVYQGPQRLADRLQFIQELLATATTIDLSEYRAEAYIWNTIDQLASGNIQEAKRSVVHLDQLFSRIRHPYYQYAVSLFRVTFQLLAGQLLEARQSAIEAQRLGHATNVSVVDGNFGVQMFCLTRELGQLPALVGHLERIAESQSDSLWRPGLVITYATLGDRVRAKEHFERLAENDFAGLAADGNYPQTLTYLAEVADFLEDESRAASLYHRLLDYEGQTLLAGGATVCYGAASRYLGILARRLNQLDVAEHHFRDAIQMNQSLGARCWLAHSMLDYVQLLQHRKMPGDRTQATQLYQEVQQIASDACFQWIRDRAARIGAEFGV